MPAVGSSPATRAASASKMPGHWPATPNRVTRRTRPRSKRGGAPAVELQLHGGPLPAWQRRGWKGPLSVPAPLPATAATPPWTTALPTGLTSTYPSTFLCSLSVASSPPQTFKRACPAAVLSQRRCSYWAFSALSRALAWVACSASNSLLSTSRRPSKPKPRACSTYAARARRPSQKSRYLPSAWPGPNK